MKTLLTLLSFFFAAAPSPAEEGMIYYDIDDHKLKVYNGTTWTDCN